MIRVLAETIWYRHLPGAGIQLVEPGKEYNLPDGIAKAAIRLKWAVQI